MLLKYEGLVPEVQGSRALNHQSKPALRNAEYVVPGPYCQKEIEGKKIV
jgi:hypothetical protein